MKNIPGREDRSDKRVYYAHSMVLYNTSEEEEDVEFLKQLYKRVICPNKDIGKAERGMKAYLKIVEWADLLVVREFEGFIGFGVYKEIWRAKRFGIPVKCIRGKRLIEVKDAVIRNPRDYRKYYAELITE